MKNAFIDTNNKIDSLNESSIEKVMSDYDIMLNFAVKRGVILPKQLILESSNQDNDQLVTNYNDLSRAILPSTAESITYINNYIFRNGTKKKWYQIPIYSKNLFLSFIALISVIVISLSNVINHNSLDQGILNSGGITLLINLLFICSFALLGVMFYTIKSINDKIKSYSLTEIDVLTLNSSIFIGVISGFIISEVFSSFIITGMDESVVITKMTLAILGGFSADAIFSMLQGFVNKIKALFTST